MKKYSLLFLALVLSMTALAAAPDYFMELPMEIEPTSEQWNHCTKLDVNGDGRGWMLISSWGDPYFYSGWHKTNVMDDWLILPAVKIDDAAPYYYFSMLATLNDPNRGGNELEVCYGTEPTAAAMTNVIISKFDPAPDWEKKETLVHFPSAGYYYIGLHATDPADHFGSKVREIVLKDAGYSASSPTAPTSLTATPATNGDLKASFSFVMPSVTVSGSQIASGTSLTATLKITSKNDPDAEAKVYTATGTPGQTLTVSNAVTFQGMNVATVSAAAGSAVGQGATCEFFTGEHAPGNPSDFTMTMSANMMSLHFAWTAPSASADGGYFNPANVDYYIYKWDEEEWEWVLMKEAGRATECDLVLPADTPQEYFTFLLWAANEGGDCPDGCQLDAVAGSLYRIPVTETFDSTSDRDMEPWQMWSGGVHTTLWSTQRCSSFDEEEINSLEGGVLYGYPSSSGADEQSGLISTPFFLVTDLTGGKAVVKVWAGADAPSQIHFYAEADATEDAIELGEFSRHDGGWVDMTLNFPETIRNNTRATLFIEPFYTNKDQCCIIDSITFEGVYNHIADGISSPTVADPDATEIYTLSGVRVNAADLLPGIYIVRHGGKTTKIAVR